MIIIEQRDAFNLIFRDVPNNKLFECFLRNVAKRLKEELKKLKENGPISKLRAQHFNRATLIKNL